jgi:hypothetical protein
LLRIGRSVGQIFQIRRLNSLNLCRARTISLQLRESDSVWLRVSDDGDGFDVSAPRSSQSFGLTSMRERAESLGGRTVTAHLERAARAGIAVHVWFVCLNSVERHLARIERRVLAGGHSIPADKVRERYETSRANLIRLLPHLAELALVDNSRDVPGGAKPVLVPIAHHRRGKPLVIADLEVVPDWAKPIAAALFRL